MIRTDKPTGKCRLCKGSGHYCNPYKPEQSFACIACDGRSRNTFTVRVQSHGDHFIELGFVGRSFKAAKARAEKLAKRMIGRRLPEYMEGGPKAVVVVWHRLHQQCLIHTIPIGTVKQPQLQAA